MEIPMQARKCPYCHHFQNRLVLFMYHPGFAVLIFSLPMVFMLIVISNIFERGENYEVYKDQISVSDNKIFFGDSKSGATVAVIGTIKNTSKVSWKEVKFHVDFFDAAGRRADVGEKDDYSFTLPASGTSSFKVSFRREFSETNYVKPEVRVVGAKDVRAGF
jgi:hypothetical protein